MPHFLCKLIPPRSTFPADITPAEGAAMQAHIAYWTELSERGVAIAFGPVADPAGAWGVGIVTVESEAELEAIQAEDPVIKANLGFRTERYPMPQLVQARR